MAAGATLIAFLTKVAGESTELDANVLIMKCRAFRFSVGGSGRSHLPGITVMACLGEALREHGTTGVFVYLHCSVSNLLC